MRTKKWVSRLMVVAFIFVTLFSSFTGTTVFAESRLLVYDGISSVIGPINGAGGGLNWKNNWETQGTNKMTISTAAPMTYSNLDSTAPYGKGGGDYQGVGRLMSTQWNSPEELKPYFNPADQYGKAGTTLWYSQLFRLDKTGGNKYVILHDSNIGWYADNNKAGTVSAGMFGGNQVFSL